MLCFVVSSVDLRNLRYWFAADEIFIFNRPSSQIPQCLRHIHVCHSVTFCNRDVAICIDFFYIEVHFCDIGRLHCGINVRVGRIQHFHNDFAKHLSCDDICTDWNTTKVAILKNNHRESVILAHQESVWIIFSATQSPRERFVYSAWFPVVCWPSYKPSSPMLTP